MNKKIYFVGIGGAGTSSLARLYIAQGYNVVGSDEGGDGFYTELLKKDKIQVFDKFDINNIPNDVEFVVHSTAFGKENIEIAEFIKRGVKVFSYPQALGNMTKKYTTIAICGTHGKTTTTAMTAYTLLGTGDDVSALVGSIIPKWSGGAKIGTSSEFVIEADEYQNKLKYYYPKVVVLTSIDYDHPDFFENFEVYKDTFKTFIEKIPKDGTLIACIDDSDVNNIVKNFRNSNIITYGENKSSDARIIGTKIENNKQYITVLYKGEKSTLITQMFGIHNARNAVAAWLVGVLFSGDKEKSALGLESFEGVSRRAERKGIYNGAILIDDYAHHPKEVSVSIKAFKQTYKNKKIIVAFHPHTYSRTKALFKDFVDALLLADEIIIIDIYSSAREKKGSISSRDLVQKINETKNVAIYKKTIKDLSLWAKNNINKDDVFVTLGAGDIWKVHELILNN